MSVNNVFTLYSSSSFEILFDLGCVFAVEPLQFLVELHVSLIDIVYVIFLIEGPSPTVLSTLVNPETKVYNAALQFVEMNAIVTTITAGSSLASMLEHRHLLLWKHAAVYPDMLFQEI